jgi:P-type Ca2+ transporter type 2C
MTMPRAAGAQHVLPLHTAVPGRVRLSVAGLRGNTALKATLERGLAEAAEVRSASASPLTGSLVIVYDSVVPLDRIVRQVARLASGTQMEPGEDIDAPASPPWHAFSQKDALRALDSTPAGLSSDAAERRRACYGLNELEELGGRSRLALLLEQFQGLPVMLLAAAAVLSLATGGLVDAAVIVGVVALNASIGFITQNQTERTIGSLRLPRQRVTPLRRDGGLALLAPDQIVPGDIMVLRPGMVVPADARIIATDGLSIDESMLTGESAPVRKSAEAVAADCHLAERTSMGYSGTVVVGGSGLGLAVATGVATEAGRIQQLVGEAKAPETPLQSRLRALGGQLVLFSAGICALVFLLGLLRGRGVLAMLKSSIALAVAAIPEGLPTVATTVLALGVEQMRRQHVLVRRLDAIETLAAVDVVALDKTGTLTENRMAAAAVVSAEERWARDDGAANGAPIGSPGPEIAALLEIAALCNEASVAWVDPDWSIDGSATETALIRLAIDAAIDVPALRRRFLLESTEYRSDERQYMITAHRNAEGRRMLAVKGNPEQVLSLCGSEMRGGRSVRLTPARRAAILAQNHRLGEEGLRVLGFGRWEPGRAGRRAVASGEEEAPRRFTWLGLIGLSDPLRPGMEKLLRRFERAGIRVMMMTGDQRVTAAALARRLKFENGGAGRVVDSVALNHLDETSAAALVERSAIFARVTPAEKLRIVRLLQGAGRTVAMVGDGINDSPALRAADVGVVMGRGGADTARAVADIVLQRDELATLTVAIERGRAAYANIGKAIQFLLATNLSEMLVVLLAVLAGFTAPLNPLQLLWINLLTDVLPAVGLALEPAERGVLEEPPLPRGEPIIGRADLVKLAREGSVIAASGLAAYGYGRLRYGATSRASTLAFTSLVGAQLLHALACRSSRYGLFTPERLGPNRVLAASLAGALALQLAAVGFAPLRRLMGLAPLGFADALVSVALSFVPYLTSEAAKLAGSGKNGDQRGE